MGTPLISVVVPVYNVADYLPECLDSLLAQTYPFFEVVAVNDGSTDSSLAILERYSNQDPRITIVSQRNGGLAAARNTGVTNARGEYIAFVDSDDYVEELYLSSMLDNALKHNAEISICGRMIVVDGSETHELRLFCSNCEMGSEMALRALNSYRSYDMSMCGKLFKSSLFEGISFPEGKNSEDQFVCYKLLSKAAVIFYEDRPLYFYRHRAGSISRGSRVNIFPIEASHEQLWAIKDFAPKLVYAGETSCFFSQVAVFNAFAIRRQTLPKAIGDLIAREAPRYLNSVVKNPDLSLRKKIQAVVFVFMRPLYKAIYITRKA